MVKLRLKRFGRRNRPYYRVCVMDMRSARDSAPIEELGHYDPIEKDAAKGLQINAERAKYWLSVGAQPSERVTSLLRGLGVMESKKAKPSA
ncbi:MAG: 30S ribosomal protein S16 [Phycisphaeraceae bacterium]|nr:30S ribosomal protein S16 [Phycisphaeraceae bacterium]